MEAAPDKRSDQRQDLCVPIEVSVVSAVHWEEITSSSVNISRKGLHFISVKPFTPRTVIRIRTHPSKLLGESSSSGIPLPTLIIAEVKWCQPVVLDSGLAFRVGAYCILPGLTAPSLAKKTYT
jgi:hypothetical protein